MRPLATSSFVTLVFSSVLLVHAQNDPDDPPSYPHAYPGMPTGDFSPEWQNYFQVTQPLTNVTWELSRNWAGNIGVGDAQHPNNTLFFWAFEKENGSLTAGAGERSEEPWGIWVDGFVSGASGQVSGTTDSGPILIDFNYTVSENPHSYHHAADWFWLDSMVGSGYSTEEPPSNRSEEQIAADFYGFLENLVKVFPSLRKRPLYLVSESYGGEFLSYMAKAYFNLSQPPVNLRKIAIGRSLLGTHPTWGQAAALQIIQTYPQLIGYDPKVYEHFKEEIHVCGYDLNLTYPQVGKLPILDENRESPELDSFYGCGVAYEMTDYAFNHSLPYSIGSYWRTAGNNAPGALDIQPLTDPSVFLDDNANRAALHAPVSKNWSFAIDQYPGWENDPGVYSFFDELATNATKHGVQILLYGRNADPMLPHFSTEVFIQNATFGGIQGFTRKPSTPWYDDRGEFAGIVHQERNLTYVLVYQSGWLLPEPARQRTLSMIREFVVGNNQTGLVTTSANGEVSVIGGEDPELYARGILRAPDAVAYRINGTVATYTYPNATIEAWNKYVEQAIPTTPITQSN